LNVFVQFLTEVRCFSSILALTQLVRLRPSQMPLHVSNIEAAWQRTKIVCQFYSSDKWEIWTSADVKVG